MHQSAPSALRILSVALFCQGVAGVEYWWPALLTSLQPLLHFSTSQSLILAAVANSGGSLGIPVGFFHSYYGNRKTALLGSVALAALFLTLAFLPSASEEFKFPVALAVTGLTIPAAYGLYTSGISLSSAAFPPSFRGRVIGLQTAAFAASAAIYASIQSAFFPTPESATKLLLCCAAVSTFAGILVALFFPSSDHFDTEPYYDLGQGYESISQAPSSDTLISTRIILAYSLMLMLLVVLQFGAISHVFFAPSVFLKAAVFAMVPIVVLLLTYVPFNFPLRLRATVAVASDTEPSESILSVTKDVRFHYLALARLLLISGGSVTLLIQSHNIVASRLALTRPDAIPAAIRTVVLIFSTANLAVRVPVGLSMDAPTDEESLIRKYNILHMNSLILAVTLPLLALMPYQGILIGVAVVGMCHGIFFSCAPALCTVWFGARQYPRNWSTLGPFHAVGVATIATALPAFLMAHFGTWVTVGEERMCVGVSCTFPTFAVIGMLNLVVYGAGWLLKKNLQR